MFHRTWCFVFHFFQQPRVSPCFVFQHLGGAKGPCFVFRVSCFVFQIFRACGALGLRGRLRRALRDQYLNSTPKASIKVYDDCTYSTKRNHCIRRARFASASASCRALPALRFSASDSWRRSKVAAAAAAVAARCASAAQAVSRAEGQRTFWGPKQFRPCFVFHFSVGRCVSCFTFWPAAVFRVSHGCVSRVSCFGWTEGETPLGAELLCEWLRQECSLSTDTLPPSYL